ncbi:polysaccharide biosynthesis protein [Paenimyroides ceti]|nr:nucleoside-diphosphate sugar epimerase/dehydratase [Paenimyroides ceti]
MKTKLTNPFNTLSKDKIKNIGYLPRWIILFIDFFIVSISAVIGSYILDGIGLNFFPDKNSYWTILLYLITHLFFFWKYKTFAGIIRHTTLVDAIQLFWSEFSVLITLYIINVISSTAFDYKIFLNTHLLICCILSYCLLLAFRILVKSMFETYLTTSNNNDLINTIIYGSDNRALTIANAIITESPKRFHLVGFVDKKPGISTNRILNLPLLNVNRKISVLARKLGAQSIIIADNTLNNEEKISIIDDCLQYNIKVFNLPYLNDMSNQKTIAANIRNIKIQDLLERKPIELDNCNISKQLNDKVVLVSGGAGSIGSEIVWQVSKFNPKKILIVDQAETPLHQVSLEMQKNDTSCEIIPIILNIKNKELLEAVFQKYQPDVVYHAAAYKHVPLMENHPEQAIQTNVFGTKVLADLSVKYNVDRFVMVSTDKAVNPSNIMGASKRIAEKYVQSLDSYLKDSHKSRTKFITTRFGNVLGSNGSVVPLFTKQIEMGGPITITHPDIIRYFMTIPEACQLVLEAGSMGNGGEVYIFDMGKPVKIIDLAHKMIRLAGLIPDQDIEIRIVGLRPGEKLYEELLNDSSKTLPTHHEKIMIAVDDKEHYISIDSEINALHDLSYTNITEMVIQMKKIVPEFKSLNSDFQKLDV